MPFPDYLLGFLNKLRYRRTPTPTADGQVVEQLADAYGRPRVVVEQIAPPGIVYARDIDVSSLVALETSGQLVELWGWNAGGSDVYVQLHDAATLPGNGAVPLEVFKVAAGTSFAFSPSAPLPLASGLVVAASSSRATLTINLAATLVVTAAVVQS